MLKCTRLSQCRKPVSETETETEINSGSLLHFFNAENCSAYHPFSILYLCSHYAEKRERHKLESAANSSSEMMSLQHPEPDDCATNNNDRAESLKVWSCVNCRRRKVRCDRRHPCASCAKNKSECVFPSSGRIPRRGRDASYPRPLAKKQAELVGRLRRLEAMVGDLGSQVEHAAAVSQGSHAVESSTIATDATSATSSEPGWIDHQLTPQSQSASGYTHTTRDGVQRGANIAKDTSESPHVSDESGEVVVASNGDVVVGNQFWTVFCKEVCSKFAPLFFALPTGVELGICS